MMCTVNNAYIRHVRLVGATLTVVSWEISGRAAKF